VFIFNITSYSSYYMLWLPSQFFGNILLLNNLPVLLAIEHVSNELRKSKLLFMTPKTATLCTERNATQCNATSCLVVLYCPVHAHSRYRVINV